MPETLNGRATKKPPIHLSDTDYDRIADIALRLQHSNPALSELLLDEIDRARIHPAAKLPRDVVAIGSEVEFLDESSGVQRRMILVLPQDADIEAGRISVMTPMGAGLVGMKAGQEISWPRSDGRPRTLKIIEVKQQP